MQAGGLAPRRAKIDPNAFSGAAGAMAVESQVAPTYRHGRKRLASVVPEAVDTVAADAGASSGRTDGDSESPTAHAASSTLLATKSFKGIRDAVIQRNTHAGSGLLSGQGPRSDASPADTPKSGSAAIGRAQKARGDWFKRLFPNSHARLMEEQATSGRAATAASESNGPTHGMGADEPASGKGGIGGGLVATRL